MKHASHVVPLTVQVLGLLLAGLAGGPAALSAQEPCPRASGPDAEAGWAAYAADDMDRARQSFQAALARCPEDDYARTGLGYVLLRAGDVEDAGTLWRAVVASEPDNVDALVGLGLAAWRLGDLDEVRSRFEHVVELVPDHGTALEYLERVAGATAVQPLDPADEAWANGDTELALELYQARLASDPEDGLAALRVALMLAWSGQYDPSIELLNALISRQPAHVDARLARARVRAWSGDLPTAQREVLEVLAVQPDNAEALEALGLFQAWAGDMEGALGTYDELISIAPQSGSAGRQQARALAWASQFEAATAAYEALLERNPNDVDARLGYAQALAYAQQLDSAIAQYDVILEASPSELRALTGRAKALGWAGRLVEAERVALRAVDADRSSAEAWAGLGQLYRWQGRDADAKDAFEMAVQLAPTSAEILDQLRSVNLAFAPVARPTVVHERDSDDNRMTTTSLSGRWHPTPRLEVRASGFRRALELGIFERSAQGASVVAYYQLQPGWRLSAGVGGSRSDGVDNPSFLEYQVGVRTPERSDYVFGLDVSSRGLTETAALANVGVRSTEVLASGRWMPGQLWRFDGSVGMGWLDGTETNGRRSASLAASRRVGRFFTVGASFRGFSFQKDLLDGYFDPDFYGIAEATGAWLYRPGPWTLLAELAPGLQRVRTDGDIGSSLRTNLRVAYGFGPGREVSLSFGYSSAGLVSFATGQSGYSYTAFILGSSWTF